MEEQSEFSFSCLKNIGNFQFGRKWAKSMRPSCTDSIRPQSLTAQKNLHTVWQGSWENVLSAPPQDVDHHHARFHGSRFCLFRKPDLFQETLADSLHEHPVNRTVAECWMMYLWLTRGALSSLDACTGRTCLWETMDRRSPSLSITSLAANTALTGTSLQPDHCEQITDLFDFKSAHTVHTGTQ